MIGQVISHYKILEKLGEGGMGIVYRAHDTKLDRTVALKFLPPQLSATDQDKVRFLQEARAAAALNHPHICHINRIDEVDAPPASGRAGEKLMFIEMEHVDGVTLRAKLAAGPIPLADALALATQIGEGLEEAHAKGIIHRDIKSDNVMVNARGQAKVMDFGLAKLKGALKLTRSSSTVGTIAYMAPEQLRGAEADARSDIFSFGVLLYEMLTGRLPFEGAHEAALMYSITNEAPVPLEKYLSAAPSELLHIIHRSLEKDPEDRYQTVHDMVIDIRRVRKDTGSVSRHSMPAMPRLDPAPSGRVADSAETSGLHAVPPTETGAGIPEPPPRRTSSVTIPLPTGGKRWAMIAAAVALVAAAAFLVPLLTDSGDGDARMTIAVADFENQTQEPELNGLSGMLITAMEQSKRLSVVTRTHMFDILKQMGKGDVARIDEAVGKEICSRAGIGALVTASIQKFGKLYTIDLKVLDPSKNDYLFTAKEQGEGQESIPAMLDRLSEKTRAGLKEKAEEIRVGDAALAAVTTSNMEAYQHFFKGEEFINKLDMSKAEEELRKAVALDSLFGLAWYRLGYVIDWRGASSGRENDALPKALALIDRIPEKERYLVRAIAARGWSDFHASIMILKEMESRYPNDKEMMYNIGDWSYHDNDLTAAAEYLEKTLAIDPVHERALQHLTWTYRDLGRYDAMFRIAEKFALVAKSNESFTLLKNAYTLTGRTGEAIPRFTSLLAAYPGNLAVIRSLAELLRLEGRLDDAEKELRKGVDSAGALKLDAIQGLLDHYAITGQRSRAAAIAAEGLAKAAREKDTAAVIDLKSAMAWLELTTANAPARAKALMDETAAYDVPAGDLDYWYQKAWMGIFLDPTAPLPAVVDNKPFTPIFQALRSSRRGECGAARAMADSILIKGFPAEVRITLLGEIAACYHDAGRLVDARRAADGALSQPELQSSFFLSGILVTSGKIHEGMGNAREALAAYDRFLALWKKADADLPRLVDVKQRVARLRSMSAR